MGFSKWDVQFLFAITGIKFLNLGNLKVIYNDREIACGERKVPSVRTKLRKLSSKTMLH